MFIPPVRNIIKTAVVELHHYRLICYFIYIYVYNFFFFFFFNKNHTELFIVRAHIMSVRSQNISCGSSTVAIAIYQYM